MKGAYVFLKNNGVTIGFATGTVLALLAIMIMVGGFPKDATTEMLYGSSIFDFAIMVTFILIVVGVAVAFFGPVIYTAMNFKESLKFLAILGVMLVLLFISMGMGATPSDSDLLFYQGVDNKHLTGKDIAFVDSMLIYTSIMILLTFASLAFMFVWGLLKAR